MTDRPVVFEIPLLQRQRQPSLLSRRAALLLWIVASIGIWFGLIVGIVSLF